MCGIVGMYNHSDDDIISDMLSCIQHRGPDSEGRFIGSNVAMGARRLSIIDLQNGTQPMWNEDEDVVVVFNGEIYNHENLRSKLKNHGHKFQTRCDTEVLVHLWEEYGTNMVRHLEGMFALSIWDDSDESLFLARDRLGIKPLYIHNSLPENFIWASELPAILQTDVERTVDDQALYNYLSLKYTPNSATMVSGIKKLPPATWMLISSDRTQTKKYWNLEQQEVTDDVTTAASNIRELLEQSVKNRLMADVPVGAYLSGGIDSASIVALASKYTDNLNTYSVGFSTDYHDETAEAEFVADHFDTSHHTINVEPGSMYSFEKVVRHHGEPLADPAALPTMLLSQRASEDVRVILAGTGADELFYGYDHYEKVAHYRRKYGSLPKLAHYLAGILGNIETLPNSNKFSFFSSLTSDAEAYLNYYTRMGRANVRPEKIMNTSANADELLEIFESSTGDIDPTDSARRIACFEIKHFIPDDLLMKLDRNTMAESIEGRVPFLDHRLVNYAYSLPSNIKMEGEYKPLLRNAMSDLLPERTLMRNKSQFSVPVEDWFENGHDVIDKWMTEEKISQTPYINSTEVFNVWKEHQNTETFRASTLWRVLNYVTWYHTVLKE